MTPILREGNLPDGVNVRLLIKEVKNVPKLVMLMIYCWVLDHTDKRTPLVSDGDFAAGAAYACGVVVFGGMFLVGIRALVDWRLRRFKGGLGEIVGRLGRFRVRGRARFWSFITGLAEHDVDSVALYLLLLTLICAKFFLSLAWIALFGLLCAEKGLILLSFHFLHMFDLINLHINPDTIMEPSLVYHIN